MVSLYDLVQSQQQLRRISTGVPSLDDLLFSQSFSANRIYDFQSTPGNSYTLAVIVQLIITHLQSGKSAVVVDSDAFPVDMVVRHAEFQLEWRGSRFTLVRADTFAKTYVAASSLPADSMVVFNGFHEMVELYKYEVVSAYEEAIYKYQLERKDAIITGAPRTLLPQNSDLVGENPLVKFTKHLFLLMDRISGHSIEKKSIVVLSGHMDPVYNEDLAMMVLANSLDYKHMREHLDSYVTARAYFYRDWYDQSVSFKELGGEEYERLVAGVRVEKDGMISQGLYFDVRNGVFLDLSRSVRSIKSRIEQSRDGSQSFESGRFGSQNRTRTNSQIASPVTSRPLSRNMNRVPSNRSNTSLGVRPNEAENAPNSQEITNPAERTKISESTERTIPESSNPERTPKTITGSESGQSESSPQANFLPDILPASSPPITPRDVETTPVSLSVHSTAEPATYGASGAPILSSEGERRKEFFAAGILRGDTSTQLESGKAMSQVSVVSESEDEIPFIERHN